LRRDWVNLLRRRSLKHVLKYLKITFQLVNLMTGTSISYRMIKIYLVITLNLLMWKLTRNCVVWCHRRPGTQSRLSVWICTRRSNLLSHQLCSKNRIFSKHWTKSTKDSNHKTPKCGCSTAPQSNHFSRYLNSVEFLLLVMLVNAKDSKAWISLTHRFTNDQYRTQKL